MRRIAQFLGCSQGQGKLDPGSAAAEARGVLRRRQLLLGAAALLACRRQEPSSDAPPALRAGWAPLRDDFDAEAARVRVVALLSPT
jgi:hypothetical protein